jgi:hypothetical protein
MLIIKRGRVTTEKWFADRLSLVDAFGIVIYRQVSDTTPKPCFFRKAFSTILINLAVDPDDLLNGFARQTRSQIKKAEHLGIDVAEASIDDLVPFYNTFARAKHIPTIKGASLRKMKTGVTVTQAKLNGETLVMHCHLMDPDICRVRCLFSASKRLTDSDPDKLKVIGYANRYLHWRDMLLFRGKGYRTYDFGGYSRRKDDQAKQQINQFKAGFSKNIVDEYTYASIFALLLRKLRSI